MTDVQDDTLAAAPHIDGLAWSTEPDPPPEPPRHSWRTTLKWAAGAVASATLISGVALVLFVDNSTQQQQSETPSQVAGPTETIDVGPTTLRSVPDLVRKDPPDAVFQRAYKQYVSNLYISDLAPAIQYGHTVCEWMREHEVDVPAGTVQEAAAQEILRLHANLPINIRDTRGIVFASSRAYCPQYDAGPP